ncbi:virulence factor TspB C-terminal domain-related protein [Vogesella indigofera]|uniref:virulence factor TspB C-terminal domain-related protein n=1 Tax=Vogesella indigofera TaxID=45465 RepID=UPI00234EE2A1|nr:virulence factor TspB C-terminal domain-related protein [Vogesella indigofera]MDC7706739.1 virulence factor TspB C-terminal domain-related protein [Vogesella indigofera]
MRHLRAFLYFFVGVLIALNASFAFAQIGKYVPGGYYQYGNQVTRKFKDYEDSKRLTNTMQEVYKADSNSLGITTQFAFDMEAQMTSPRVTDHYKVPINPLVDAAKKGAERGFKGLRGGIPGVVGAIAGGIVMDALVEEGLQWYDENQQWKKMEQAGFATRCDVAGNPACSGYAYFSPTSGFMYTKYGSVKLLSVPLAAEVLSVANSSLPSLYGPYTLQGCVDNNPTSWSTDCTVVGNAPNRVYATRISHYNTTKPKYAEPKSPVPLTEAQLNDAIKRAIESSMLPFVSGMQQDNTPIELDDSIQATTVGDAAISQPKTTTSTQINPDGSRIIENKTSTFTATPVGTGTIGGDITLNTDTTTQTTINSCTADGVCEITEKTETETETETEVKSDCEKNPSALSCVGLGDIPNADIPANEKRFSLTPHTFNMTAACPAPVQFTVRNQLYSVSYQPICDFAGFIKALVLISAVVSAYFICFGTRREGN